jgi:hypothetical protein
MAQCIYRHMPNFYQWVERRNFENFDCLDVGAKTISPFSTLRHRLIVLIQEATMRQYTVYEFDNRDSAQVYQYMEASKANPLWDKIFPTLQVKVWQRTGWWAIP